MSEALKLAANFGIEVMQLKRVIAITTKDNYVAINLLNRNNFKFIKEREIDFVYVK